MAVATGTGAFSTAEASRGVDLAVASDSDGALLRLSPVDGPNGVFAQDSDGDGTLDLEFDGDAVGATGSGPNAEAVTRLVDVFTISNQGTVPVGVWIDDGRTPAVTFHTADDGHGSIEGRANAYVLLPGESVRVSLVIDTTDTAAGTVLLDTVTVRADATATERAQP